MHHSPLIILKMVSTAGHEPACEIPMGFESIPLTARARRATLHSERHWTSLDLEAGSIVWAIKRLRGYLSLGYEAARFLGPHKALENLGKVGDHNDACYNRCRAPLFLRESSIWELETCPKNWFGDKSKLLPPEKKCHGLGTQQEPRPKNGLFPTIWG